MIPDRLQFFLDFFGTTNNVTKYGPSNPVSITKNTLKIQEKYGSDFEEYSFHICESEFLKILEGVCVSNF